MTFPYKMGLLPGKIPVGLKELPYYSAGPLPKPLQTVAIPQVSDWNMLGNSVYGDCGVASWEHSLMADAAVTQEQETEASEQQAIAYYLAYTGGQDSGVVLSDFLAYVRQHGYYGHTLKAYAPVGVHDIPTLQTAISYYVCAYTGIAVTSGMQEAFQNGQPWTTNLLSTPVVGGHAVPLVAFDDQYLYAITWAAVQKITYPMWHYISSEAWALITGELIARNGDARGVSLSALEADLDSLTK